METKKHFVLVHGGFHGAWCWYKLVPLLKLAGHQVTALDLGACGVNPKQIYEMSSIEDYAQPLMAFMASLSKEEGVILVGHSFGGIVISLAMEKFPEKILVSVFVTAFMPNHTSPPASPSEELSKLNPSPAGGLFDCQLVLEQARENPPTSHYVVGPYFLASVLYLKCQPEDLELAKMLVRPTKLFLEDLGKESLLTESKFGSVDRVFVICEEDVTLNDEYQKWMIANNPPKEAKIISGASHMAMLTKPQELCQCLQDVAESY